MARLTAMEGTVVEPGNPSCRDVAVEDGIDPEVWTRLSIIARAAARADARGYAGEVLTWGHDFRLAGQHWMGVYLMYALGYQVKLLLERNKPTGEELRQTAVAVHPHVLRVLDRATATQLEETLRVAFDLPWEGIGVTPAEFLVFAGAILGVLMSDPDAELAAIRPRLAIWLHRHRESFREQGLVGYNTSDDQPRQ
jgi:hypothetical protein